MYSIKVSIDWHLGHVAPAIKRFFLRFVSNVFLSSNVHFSLIFTARSQEKFTAPRHHTFNAKRKTILLARTIGVKSRDFRKGITQFHD